MAAKNRFRFGDGSEAKRAYQETDVLEILKFLASSQRQTLHGQQVFGMRGVDSKVAQLFENLETAGSA